MIYWVTKSLSMSWVVTLTRNPWDRMASYWHWLQAQSFDHPAVSRARTLPFRAFLDDRGTRAEMANDTVDRYLTLADGQVAKGDVIRLEHMDEDMEGFRAHLGFDPAPGHLNRSERPADYAALYDEAAKELVRAAYAPDITRFGYRFVGLGGGPHVTARRPGQAALRAAPSPNRP